MKKVLIVTYYAPPVGMAGVLRVTKLAKFLPEFGWQPILLTVKPISYFLYDPDLLNDLAGITIYRSESLDPARLLYFFRKDKPITVKSTGPLFINYLLFPDAKVLWVPFAVSLGKKLIEQEFPDMLASKGGLYNTFTEDIDGMIVPVPEKVYILGEYLEDMIKTEVLDIKKQFINDLCTIVKTMPVEQTVAASTFLNSLLNLSESPIVLRTYLIPSVKYKESLTKKPLATEMHEIVRDKYKRLGMPRYIWVTEITTAEMMSKEIQSERKILGEIIVDATANKYSFSAFLAVHLPGMLAINDINKKIDDTDKKPIQKFPLPNDKPYSHAIRG